MMSDLLVVRSHPVFPRAHEVTSATPFTQSQCTGGYLCGTAFQQNGCYATPDYSTCQYSASAGVSVCTVCICYGYDSGQTGCSRGSGSSSGTSNNFGLINSSSKRSVPLKSLLLVLLLCVLRDAIAFGLF